MVISEIMGGSVTSTIAIAVVVFLTLFLRKFNISTQLACKCTLIGALFLSYFIISIGVNSSIGELIEIYLNRSLTFSGRTVIWSSAINSMQNHFWLGLGWTDIPLNWNWDVQQCHNTFLDMLFVGGVLLLFLFILLMFVSLKNLYKNKNVYVRCIFSSIFIGYCIVFLMEARRLDIGFFLFLVMMFYSSRINKCII